MGSPDQSGPKFLGRRAAEPREFFANVRQRTSGQIVGETTFDPIHRADQEVAGAHRDVGDPELKEPPSRLSVWHSIEPPDVLVERRFERPVEEMFDGEGRGVVGPGGLPRSRAVAQIHFARANFHRVAGLGRKVGFRLGVHHQVCLGKRKLALQQTLIGLSLGLLEYG